MVDFPGGKSSLGYFLPAGNGTAVPSDLALPSSQAGKLVTEVIQVTRHPDLQIPAPQPPLHSGRAPLEH